jgi:hypothetical protein
MAFHSGKYDTYVILGDPNVLPLWHWQAWKRLLPTLDPLIQRARGKPAVRSTQYLADPTQGIVKFGRIGWNESDHQKWTHGSPKNKEKSKSWGFLCVEIWAPAWTACERENRAPDVFLCIKNEYFGGGHQKTLLFNPVVVLAVVSALAERVMSQVSAAVTGSCKVVLSKFVGYRKRPWGISFGSDGFTNSIQDFPEAVSSSPATTMLARLAFTYLRRSGNLSRSTDHSLAKSIAFNRWCIWRVEPG